MSHQLKPDIVELCQLLIRAEGEFESLLSSEESEAFAATIDRFATALQSPDPDDQRDAWLEARQKLKTFAAFRRIDGEKRKFFDPNVEIPPQSSQEVVPQLIACAKKIRAKAKSKENRKGSKN